MTFHMDILKECFPSWLNLRVCQVLMRDPTSMSQRQLARVLGIPIASFHRALKSLGETGLIRPCRVGNTTSWKVAREGYLFKTLEPVLKGLNSITPPLQYLKETIQNIVQAPKGSRVILFGSTASATDTATSDIDLCIILPGNQSEPPRNLKKQLDQLRQRCLDEFGRNLNPLFLASTELSRKPSKSLHVDILKGIEIR